MKERVRNVLLYGLITVPVIVSVVIASEMLNNVTNKDTLNSEIQITQEDLNNKDLITKELLDDTIRFQIDREYNIWGRYSQKGYIELNTEDIGNKDIKYATLITKINENKNYTEVEEEEIIDNKININEKVKLEKGDECISYILLEDNYGFRYKYLLDKFNINDKGQLNRENEYYGCIEIRDKTYKLLWAKQKKDIL